MQSRSQSCGDDYCHLALGRTAASGQLQPPNDVRSDGSVFRERTQGMQLIRFLRLRKRLPQSEGCDLPAIPSITVATAGGLGGEDGPGTATAAPIRGPEIGIAFGLAVGNAMKFPRRRFLVQPREGSLVRKTLESWRVELPRSHT